MMRWGEYHQIAKKGDSVKYEWKEDDDGGGGDDEDEDFDDGDDGS